MVKNGGFMGFNQQKMVILMGYVYLIGSMYGIYIYIYANMTGVYSW